MHCVRAASSDKGPISAGVIHCFQLSLKNLSIHINLLYNVSNYWLIHRELLCFHYYCRTCWESRHQNLRSHKPLMRSYYRYQNISSITHIVALTRTQRPQATHRLSELTQIADLADVWRILPGYIGCCSDFAQISALTWHVSETSASTLKMIFTRNTRSGGGPATRPTVSLSPPPSPPPTPQQE